MKVELLVTLKSSEGLFGKGDIFSDPIPTTLLNEIKLGRPTVRILEGTEIPRQEEPKPEEAPAPPADPPKKAARQSRRTLKK